MGAEAKKCGVLFWENLRKPFFCFWENIRNFLILELETSISWNTRDFIRGFHFLNFLNIRAKRFHFQKFKEFFLGWIFLFLQAWAEKCGGLFWENIRNLRVRKFHFSKYKEFFSRRVFFYFKGLGLKSAPGSPKVY